MRHLGRLTAAAAALALLATASAASATVASTVDFTTLQLNGVATATANDLNLGDGNGGEAASAFLMTPISSSSSFTSSFDFTLVGNGFNPQADGVAFVIQADPAGPAALGFGGGNIGANGISNIVGIGFQSWDNNHATIFTTDVYGGTQPLGNFNLGDQDDNVSVSLSYAGHVLSYTATNSSTGATVSDSFNIDLTTLGPKVYLGFTGGTGLSYAFQDVHDWNLSVSPVPEPGTWGLMIAGAFGLGLALRARRRQAIVNA
jgi:hypothetical protein